jgi:hypothetical protein
LLFDAPSSRGIRDGTITMTFRRWKRAQAVAGRRYRTPGGIIEVDAVDIVDPGSITEEEARRAGHATAAEVRARLRGPPDLPVYRVSFRLSPDPDPRAELAGRADLSEAEAAELDRRLTRLDRSSPRGPWTEPTLRTIARHPEVRAGDLATALGRDRHSFKIDVRKLKNLGLTLSYPIGYRLSPRGEAYLAHRDGRPPPHS